jgi:hypothetical protein
MKAEDIVESGPRESDATTWLDSTGYTRDRLCSFLCK